MLNPRRSMYLCVPLILSFLAQPCAGQVVNPSRGMGEMGANDIVEKQNWHVYGRVHTLSGQAVHGAKVRMDVGGFGGVKETETDLLGRFSQVFELNTTQYKTLRVNLLVTMSDYQDARMVVDFPEGKTWELDVTLMGITDDPNQLSHEDLISRVGARLNEVRDEIPDSARKKYAERVPAVLQGKDSVKTAAALVQIAEKQPECMDCASLASLASLEAGDWTTAAKLVTKAAEVNEKSSNPRPEPLLILGVMEMWKGEPAKGATFFQQALKIQPKDPIVLEELGRSQLQVSNYEAAEQYLAKAVEAGAPPDARLLRVRALLGMNDAQAADQEMTKYLAGKEIRNLPPQVRILYSLLQGRLELAAYGQVKSFLDQPVKEIEQVAPELKGIQEAPNQDELPAILQKVGKSVADFFSNFPDTVSIEHVQQAILTKEDKPGSQSNKTYKYLLITKPEDKGIGLEEYRTNDIGQQTLQRGLDKGFMLTEGFASTSLFFHPLYQSGADFRLLGSEEVNGKHTKVIAFAQNPNRALFSELFHSEKESALILVQGLAWVDAGNGHILRMRTDLLKPAEKVRLARQTTEIEFAPVTFKQVGREYWLPREVTVTVDWKGKRFRNEHAYSDFQLFNVKAEENRKSSEIKMGPQGPGI